MSVEALDAIWEISDWMLLVPATRDRETSHALKRTVDMRRSGGIYHGWYLIYAGAFISMVSMGSMQAFGVFVIPMSETFDWSRSTISVAIALASLIGGSSQPIMGRIFLPPTYADARTTLEEAIGNSVRSRRTVAATYTIAALDEVVGVDTTGSALTVTLLAVNSNWDGKMYWIHDIGGNAGTNNITIATADSANINGSSTKLLAINYEAVTLITDGTNWFALGDND